MKKKIYTLSVLLAAVLPAGAQSIKSDINTVLNDIALPVFLGVMVMALAVGIGKNWRLINDENSEGNKKQGWMNVAYMVGYVLIAVTVISFCVGKIAGVSFSIWPPWSTRCAKGSRTRARYTGCWYATSICCSVTADSPWPCSC